MAPDPFSPIPFKLTTYPAERFQKLGWLGPGGMGKVLTARDRNLNRMVALKYLLAEENPLQLQRLILEAQIQASLEHPNIAKVYEVGRWEDAFCVVMQYIPGLTLDEAAKGLPLPQVLDLMAQAARGVHAAHRQGLVHRDIKPSNIMVEQTESGEAKAYVMDFGLARVLDAENSLQGPVLCGSPHFMSPEQVEGGSMVDARSDIYSLGATLYALLTGSPPFHSPSTEAQGPTAPPLHLPEISEVQVLEILRRVMDEEPRPPRQLNPHITPDVEVIVLKCMEKDPHRRYATADQLAEDLDRARLGEPILASRPSLPRRWQSWTRRHRTLAWSLGLLGVRALGVTVTLGLSLRHARQQAALAAGIEASADAMVQRWRLSLTGPLRDQTPTLQWVRSRMEDFRRGAPAQGPTAYALGRGHLLLGDLPQAQRELQRAWDLGHRTKSAAQALGWTLLQVWSEARHNLTGSDEVRAAAIRALNRDLLQPALVYLKQAKVLSEEEAFHKACIAFGEDRLDEVLLLARTSLQRAPWHYEAHVLEFRVWQRRMELAVEGAAFSQTAAQARAALDAALVLAPSDPHLYQLKAQAQADEASTDWYRFNRFRPEGLHQALATCGLALTANPGSVSALVQRSRCHRLLGGLLMPRPGQSEAVAQAYARSREDLDRALRLAPQDFAALLAKASLLITEVGSMSLEDRSFSAELAEAAPLIAQALLQQPTHITALHLRALHCEYAAMAAQRGGQDPRPFLGSRATTFQTMRDQWPEDTRILEGLVNAHLDLALAAQTAGDAPGASQALARAQAAAEGAMATLPTHPMPRIMGAATHTLAGMLQGLSGQAPSASFHRAQQLLEGVPPEERRNVDFLNERYSVGFELATLALDEGQDPGASRVALARLLTEARGLHLDASWIHEREAGLCYLDALGAWKAGRPFGALTQQGLRLIAKGQPNTSFMRPLQGALTLLDAQRLGGAARRDPMHRGHRWLRSQGGYEGLPAQWTYRHVWKLTEVIP